MPTQVVSSVRERRRGCTGEGTFGKKSTKEDGYPHTHSDLTPGRTRLLALEEGEAGSPNAQGYRHVALLLQAGLPSTVHVSQQDVDKYLRYRNGS